MYLHTSIRITPRVSIIKVILVTTPSYTAVGRVVIFAESSVIRSVSGVYSICIVPEHQSE